MEGSNLCTTCNAGDVELNTDGKCAACAGQAPKAAPEEGSDESAAE